MNETTQQMLMQAGYREQAQQGLEHLKTYAREFLINPDYKDQINDEDLIAAALSDLLTHDVEMSLAIAANLAEDINLHDLAEQIRSEAQG